VKYSRSSLVVAAAAVVVLGSSVLGTSSSSGSTGQTLSAATVSTTNNAAKATTETKCTGTSTVTDGYLRKVNVSLCAITEGHALTVKFNADCFSGAGGTQYPHCSPTGYWSLHKGKTLVTEGAAGMHVLYPGPGTYTLTASFYVEAYMGPGDGNDGISGFVLNGEMSQDITLATAIAPGPRLSGGADTVNGARTVTVTNNGDKPATGVKIFILDRSNLLGQRIVISDDQRCSDAGVVAECALGSLAPGESTSVALTTNATDICDVGLSGTPAFSWGYSADSVPALSGDGPC
jgi:hypothetical protein